MRIHSLPSITHKKKKRVGRGPGSGKGKTSGRGMKGQKARSKIKQGFEGGQLKLIKRLPFIRGRGFSGKREKAVTIDISKLNEFRSGTTITPDLLIKHGIIENELQGGIKILSNGELEKKMSIKGIMCSKRVKEMIEESGGRVD